MKQKKEAILLRKVRIVDPNSSFNGKKLDVLIENGIIQKIAKDIKEKFGTEVVEEKDMFCSPGWFDMHANVQDPGFEYKEDIDSALNAAAAGGYTGILSCSTTDPAIDNKSSVEYQLKKSIGHTCKLYVNGAISKSAKGSELAELYDMHQAGAVSFYDFKSNINNSQLLKLALQYTKSFDGLVMLQPSEPFLKDGSVMNEGEVSTENGLKGVPAIAEEMGIERAMKILDYTEHKIHFTGLSSKGSVDLIKRGRKQGLNVTCGVNAVNLLVTDEALRNFDSNFKLDPPLRTDADRKSLIKGVESGVINVITSDHWPQNVENKECEFERASFGMSSLETTFSMVNTALGNDFDKEKLVEILSINPRTILGLEVPVIEEGNAADISVFQPNEKFNFEVSNSRSRSKNTSMTNFELMGKVVGCINGTSYHIN